ncbi:MAG: hypothetical protein RL442_1, partial [Pseudomonadota bacterium]
THRAAILKLIKVASEAGVNLSMKANAPTTNIYNVLRKEDDFPRIERREFFQIVQELERERLIEQQEFRKPNRMTGQRVVLTEAGGVRVALGSGAAPTWAQREGDDE